MYEAEYRKSAAIGKQERQMHHQGTERDKLGESHGDSDNLPSRAKRCLQDAYRAIARTFMRQRRL